MPQRRVGQKTLADFCRRLAGHLRAGKPLPQALAAAAEGLSHQALRRTLASLPAEIETGCSLARALARREAYFPPLLVRLVRLGERIRALPDCLELAAAILTEPTTLWPSETEDWVPPREVVIPFCRRLAEQLALGQTWAEATAEMESPAEIDLLAGVVRQALAAGRTPMGALAQAGLGVSAVLRALGALVERSGLEEAWPWALVIAADLLTYQGLELPPEAQLEPLDSFEVVEERIGAVAPGETPIRTLPGEVFAEMAQAAVEEPVSEADLAAFCRHLATFLGVRDPLLISLYQARQRSRNAILRRVLRDIIEQLRAGDLLSRQLAHYPEIFPLSLVLLFHLGERAGVLDRMAHFIADLIEQREILWHAPAEPWFAELEVQLEPRPTGLVPLGQLSALCHDLALALRTGKGELAALRQVGRTSPHPAVRAVIQQTLRAFPQVSETQGLDVIGALALRAGASSVFVHLLDLGQAAGALDQMLLLLAELFVNPRAILPHRPTALTAEKVEEAPAGRFLNILLRALASGLGYDRVCFETISRDDVRLLYIQGDELVQTRRLSQMLHTLFMTEPPNVHRAYMDIIQAIRQRAQLSLTKTPEFGEFDYALPGGDRVRLAAVIEPYGARKTRLTLCRIAEVHPRSPWGGKRDFLNGLGT